MSSESAFKSPLIESKNSLRYTTCLPRRFLFYTHISIRYGFQTLYCYFCFSNVCFLNCFFFLLFLFLSMLNLLSLIDYTKEIQEVNELAYTIQITCHKMIPKLWRILDTKKYQHYWCPKHLVCLPLQPHSILLGSAFGCTIDVQRTVFWKRLSQNLNSILFSSLSENLHFSHIVIPYLALWLRVRRTPTVRKERLGACSATGPT